MVTVQVCPESESQPDQELKWLPPPGDSVSVTTVPFAKLSWQAKPGESGLQAMAPGWLVTLPSAGKIPFPWSMVTVSPYIGLACWQVMVTLSVPSGGGS